MSKTERHISKGVATKLFSHFFGNDRNKPIEINSSRKSVVETVDDAYKTFSSKNMLSIGPSNNSTGPRKRRSDYGGTHNYPSNRKSRR